MIPTVPAAAAVAAADAAPSRHQLEEPSEQQQQQLIARREAHQKELERLGEEMRLIQERCRNEKKSIDELTRQLTSSRAGGGNDRDADSDAAKDYFGRFEWSGRLKVQMKRVFGIGEFRLSQEGYVANSCAGCCDLTALAYAGIIRVCNANMDRRDIICIMPTGKSSAPHSIVLSTTTKCILFSP